jgi:ABC-2 type transport system permease protein
MLQRIANLISKDLLFATRDYVLVYVLVVPIVIAILFSLFVPSLEALELTFVVDNTVPADVAEKLADYGKVEQVGSTAALRQRVLDFDDVPGIYRGEGKYRIVLEGNEASYVQELPGVVIDRIVHGSSVVELETRELQRGSSLVREYTTLFLVLLCLVVGGMAMGYSIVNDRETGYLPALAVTPLTTGGYLLAKGILAGAVSLLLSLGVSAIIMGFGAVDYGALTATVVCSLGLGLIFGFLQGLLSANQLSAIALTKTLSVPFAAVPIAAIFAPDQWHWILYPFPNYWSFVALKRVYITTDLSPAMPNLLTAAISVVAIGFIIPYMTKTIRV